MPTKDDIPAAAALAMNLPLSPETIDQYSYPQIDVDRSCSRNHSRIIARAIQM